MIASLPLVPRAIGIVVSIKAACNYMCERARFGFKALLFLIRVETFTRNLARLCACNIACCSWVRRATMKMSVNVARHFYMNKLMINGN